jgi:hypothetical protein
MMKDIKYSGYSAVPSDYECQDGELAQSVNLINENGSLNSILPPKVKLNLAFGDDFRVVFVHKPNASTVHYIVYFKTESRLGWITEDTPMVNLFDGNFDFKHANAVGNTLILFCESQTLYYLWKDNKTYLSLGDHVPNIELSFGLVGHPRLFSMVDDDASTFTITFDSIKDEDIHSTFTEANKTTITSQVMAKLNRFIANETVNKGRFCFPFFVRYALRMYDGTLIGHSAPILMNPQTKPAPVVMWNRLKGKKDKYTSAELDIMMVAATLDYKVVDVDGASSIETGVSLIEKWSDIIKSIDVFISKPIYTYDQEGEITSFYDSDNFDTKFIGRLYSDEILDKDSAAQEDCILGPVSDEYFLEYYAEWDYSYIYAMYFNQERKYPSETLHLPEFSDDKNTESLRSCSTFYKLCSFDVNEVCQNYRDNVRTDIKVDDEYLQSLVAREVMTDDYLTHDEIQADYSFAYNNRMNLAGVRRKLFKGFSLQCMFAYVNRIIIYNFDSSNNNQLNINAASGATDSHNPITVYIKENGTDYTVQSLSPYESFVSPMAPREFTFIKYTDGKEVVYSYSGRYKYHACCYFFYPNNNAYKICITNGSEKMYIDLTAHDFLNGAYALLDYDTTREDNSSSFTPPTGAADDNIVSVPSKLYTSEVNNPFFYPVTGINTIGTGTLLGICSAAKALSQGQFGQFPLYAFSDEGVWALEVSSTGGYTAKQPITRDVVLGTGASITQIDSAVLFATDRGIMLISGSQSQCISDTIDNITEQSIMHLNGSKQLLSFAGLSDQETTIVPFKTFITDCRMTYDYVNQRIIVFNEAYPYAYVFSLKSKLWGMMQSSITSTVNSYPEALAMDKAGNLVDFSSSDVTENKGFLLTRPVKLETPDVLKTIDTIIQRGNFVKGHVQSALYGSRDLVNWHLVWSSKDHYLRGFRGTPYKYFRIACVTSLAKGESIYGASIQFNPRQTNQLR